MFLFKKIIERLPDVEQVRCQNLNEDSLLSMNMFKNNKNKKLYKLVPNSNFTTFDLVLNACYNKNIEISGFENLIPNIPTEKLERNEIKKKLFYQVHYKYNKFPSLIEDTFGKPRLPDYYIKCFGEFYNFNTIFTYEFVRELNRCNYSNEFFQVRVINNYKIVEGYIGFVSEENIESFKPSKYWKVELVDKIQR